MATNKQSNEQLLIIRITINGAWLMNQRPAAVSVWFSCCTISFSCSSARRISFSVFFILWLRGQQLLPFNYCICCDCCTRQLIFKTIIHRNLQAEFHLQKNNYWRYIQIHSQMFQSPTAPQCRDSFPHYKNIWKGS